LQCRCPPGAWLEAISGAHRQGAKRNANIWLLCSRWLAYQLVWLVLISLISRWSSAR
jgi:hypothetical protein